MPRRLVKAIITWAVGLGLSAIATVPSALSQTQVTREDVDELLKGAVSTLSAQIRDAKGDLQTKIDALDGRLRIVEDRRRRPPPLQPPPAPPPRVANMHGHYYYPRYWCPPPWWGPWW
jgi:hypothetical protein